MSMTPKLCWYIIVVRMGILVFFLITEKMLAFTIVYCVFVIYGLYYVEVSSFYAYFLEWSEVKFAQLCLTLCDPLDCSSWSSTGQHTRVDTLSLLQGIFPTQGSNPGLVGRFLVIVLISVLVIGLFTFSTSSWFSFGRLYFSKNLSIFPNLFHSVGI